MMQPPAPAPQAPAQNYAPTPVPQAPVNNYVPPKGGGQAPAPAPVLVPVPQYGPAVGADSGVPAEVPAPAETTRAEPPAASRSTEAVSGAVPGCHSNAGPDATASMPINASMFQASSTGGFNLLPLVLLVAVAIVAAVLVWFVRAIRAAVARLVSRKG
jgi:hypothetical protein